MVLLSMYKDISYLTESCFASTVEWDCYPCKHYGKLGALKKDGNIEKGTIIGIGRERIAKGVRPFTVKNV